MPCGAARRPSVDEDDERRPTHRACGRSLQRTPRAVGPLRPAVRARRLRRVVRRRRRWVARAATSSATALGALCNLDHRGASGAEVNTGDGAGILLAGPRPLPPAETVDFALPPAGSYGVGLAFLPLDATDAEKAVDRGREDRGGGGAAGRRVARRARRRLDDRAHGQERDAAVPALLRRRSRRARPGIDLDRKLFVLRKRCEHEVVDGSSVRRHELGAIYFPSLSCRTLVYKGMLTTPQLGEFFADLRDERIESALALVHSRFSTNTFPSWPLAHPYRYIAHNGEINTRAGQPQLDARARGADGDAAHPGARARVPDRHARARPTPPASTSASSCCTSAAGRSGTRC